MKQSKNVATLVAFIFSVLIFVVTTATASNDEGSNESVVAPQQINTGNSNAVNARRTELSRDNSSPDTRDLINSGETARGSYPFSGKLTYYGGNPTGNTCGFDQPEYYLGTDYVDFYIAAGANVFESGANCGMVIEIANPAPFNPNPACITLPDATVKVMVIDQCPECTNEHLDLALVPFAALVEPGLSGVCGILSADWRYVSAGLSGNIKVHSISGTSQFFYGFRIFGHNLPITSIEVKSSGSSNWLTTSKSQGPSFYVVDGGFPLTAPLSIRFTDVNGVVIPATDVITNFNGETIFDTGVQTTICGADEYVSANQCLVCPPGTTNESGDDSSGANTQCDVTFCSVNEFVSGNVCENCPPGTINQAGDDASGEDTECEAAPALLFEDGFED